MTDLELINYYANLLILQYKQRPKAYATIQALVAMPIAEQVPIDVQNAFDISSAIGVQLDVLGKYVGASRNGVGFLGQPITLVDADFRNLIRLKVIQNNSGSSLYEIQRELAIYFANKIYIYDYSNMRISYLLDTSVGSFNLGQVIVTGGYLPKPMAVQLSETVYSPNVLHFFAFRTYDYQFDHNQPFFNSYDSYLLTIPWLSYDDGLSA